MEQCTVIKRKVKQWRKVKKSALAKLPVIDLRTDR